MLTEYENWLRTQALEKITNAWFEYCKESLDNDICFFVPYYFKKYLKADFFNGKKIKIGYENKIIIANLKKTKYYFEYLIDN
jgi:hypothetical protein